MTPLNMTGSKGAPCGADPPTKHGRGVGHGLQELADKFHDSVDTNGSGEISLQESQHGSDVLRCPQVSSGLLIVKWLLQAVNSVESRPSFALTETGAECGQEFYTSLAPYVDNKARICAQGR